MRAGDWRLYARLDGASGGADADEVIASFVAEGGHAARGYRAPDGRVVVPFGFAEAYAGYAAELWADGAAPFGLSPRMLNAFYRFKRAIPRRAQLAARRALIRGQGEPDFPRWPFDASVAALLAVLRTLRPGRRAEAGAALPLVLAARRPRGRDPDPRRRVGRRDSATPFGSPIWSRRAGCAHRSTSSRSEYPIDWGIVEELRQRGFELGVHGVFHDRSHVLVAGGVRPPAALARRHGRAPRGRRVSLPGHPPGPLLARGPARWSTTARSRCRIPTSRSPAAAARRGPSSAARWSSSRTRSRRTTRPSPCCRSARSTSGSLSSTGSRRPSGLAQCVSHPDPGYLGDAARRRYTRSSSMRWPSGRASGERCPERSRPGGAIAIAIARPRLPARPGSPPSTRTARSSSSPSRDPPNRIRSLQGPAPAPR